MTEAEALAGLNDVFSDIFQRNDLVLERATTAEDVDGWDSLKQVEIAMAVEDAFSIRLRTREMESLKDIGELSDLIAAKVSADARP